MYWKYLLRKVVKTGIACQIRKQWELNFTQLDEPYICFTFAGGWPILVSSSGSLDLRDYSD